MESDFIEECFIHVDGTKPYLIAVVVPNLNVFRIHYASGDRQKGEEKEKEDDWVYDEETVRCKLKEEIIKVGNKMQLQYYEIPRDVLVEPKPFLEIEGMRTVTGKIFRRGLIEHYQGQFEEMYKRVEGEMTKRKDAVISEVLREVLPSVQGQDGLALDNEMAERTFQEMGGSSLDAMKLLAMLSRKFSVDIPMKVLYERNMKEIIEFIDRSAMGIEETNHSKDSDDASLIGRITSNAGSHVPRKVGIDWTEEIRLENYLPELKDSQRHFNSATLADATQAKGVFLTGATGFLGGYLLYEVLRRFPHASVWCLVRLSKGGTTPTTTSSTEERDAEREDAEFYKDDGEGWRRGRDRLCRHLKDIQCWQPEFARRIKPVIGDLAQKDFGLSEEQFAYLAERVEVIIHCGAWVNSILDYPVLKGANVVGTVNALKLAMVAKRARGTTFHHVSTTSVFARKTNKVFSQGITEDYPSSEVSPVALSTGYKQSKWVSEQLCVAARERGLPLSIFRPGMYIPHSHSPTTRLQPPSL